MAGSISLEQLVERKKQLLVEKQLIAKTMTTLKAELEASINNFNANHGAIMLLDQQIKSLEPMVGGPENATSAEAAKE